MRKEPFLKIDKCSGFVVKDLVISDDLGISIKMSNRRYPSIIGHNNGFVLDYGSYLSDDEYKMIIEEYKALETFGDMDIWD